MANLREKVLHALKNDENLETTLDNISKSQENLLKNHSNPVFNSKDKNKILKGYTDIQDIGKALYRYNTLQKHNYLDDAQTEQKNIETTVLKGGISYNKYIWRSENSEHTCDVCKDLDGQEFDFYDEVPERPHPNCRCTVEVVGKGDIVLPEEDNMNKTSFENSKPQPKPNSQKPKDEPPNQAQSQGWILPVANGHKITSGYGYRMHPVYNVPKLHDGIDINALANTPVYAVADGKVSVAGWVSGYGNYIQIEHSNGLSSFYAHLNQMNVTKNHIVKQGQIIALSGNTGIGTGPHLHFGMKMNGVSVNPTIYLPSF